MMMVVMVTMMVNVCDDDCYLVMKIILVKEVMSCDVSPVAMFCLKVKSSGPADHLVLSRVPQTRC